jgi:hypothetical protein
MIEMIDVCKIVDYKSSHKPDLFEKDDGPYSSLGQKKKRV